MNNILLWRYISFKIINIQYTISILIGFSIGISSIIIVSLLLNAYISFTENKLLGITPNITLDVSDLDYQSIEDEITEISNISGINIVNKAIYIQGNAIIGGVISGSAKNPSDTDVFIKGVEILSFKEKYINKKNILTTINYEQIKSDYSDIFSDNFLNEFNNDIILLRSKYNTLLENKFIDKYHLILDRTVTQSLAVDFEKNIPITSNISSLSYKINNRVIIDRKLATRLFYAPLNSGDEIVIKFNNLFQNNKKLPFDRNISHVFKTAGLINAEKENNGIILTSISSIKKIFPNSKVNVIEISIYNQYDLDVVVNKIKQLNYKFKISTWKEDRSGIFAILSSLDLLVFIVSVLILSITSFSLYSTLHITISEQRKTICFLKSVGVNNKSILFWFLGYGLFISIVSILLSILLSLLIINSSSLINNDAILDLFSHINYSILYSKETFLKILFIVFIIIVSTIIPSYKASTLNPATALKED